MPWVNSFDVPGERASEREIRQVLDYMRRKAKARFYADENFPAMATEILGERGADVLTVQEHRRRRHPDENHSAEALRLGRVLITCDRDFLDERRFQILHCPAIVVCDFGRGTGDEIRSTFGCLGTVFAFPQFYDKWTKIDAKRDCWTEHIHHLNGIPSRTRYRIHNGRLQEWVLQDPPARKAAA